MAGDWIKMRNNLWDDPRVSRLCDLTDKSEATIVGGLYWLWAAADEHTADGLMQGLSVTAIDRKTGIKGFGKALATIGWIDESENGITLSRFEEHNGASAKERANTAKRVSKNKAKGNGVTVTIQEKGNGSTVTNSEKSNGATVSTPLPREEKNRETTPLTPQGEKKPRPAIEFKTFLADCKAAGEKPISDYTPVFDYAKTISLSEEFVNLCWNEFYRKHNSGGASETKRYKDWRRAFRNCLEGNWYKLWWHNEGSGAYELTTAGRTAQKAAA